MVCFYHQIYIQFTIDIIKCSLNVFSAQTGLRFKMKYFDKIFIETKYSKMKTIFSWNISTTFSVSQSILNSNSISNSLVFRLFTQALVNILFHCIIISLVIIIFEIVMKGSSRWYFDSFCLTIKYKCYNTNTTPKVKKT